MSMSPRTAARAAGRRTRPAPAAAGITVVVDAGARYGMHPSWRHFEGPLQYLAVEPDPQEVERLRRQRQPEGLELIACGLGAADGRRTLRLAAHRGCSSFLPVDPRSDWFGRYRPGEGRIERTLSVPVRTLDGLAQERGLRVDFLKVDTEGTELDVLRGARRQLDDAVLGVRVNVNFRAAYRGQPLFPEVHDLLTRQGFFLLNLDYFGRGVPRHRLFRNPDPLSPDQERYGVLVATDGVWLRDADWIRGRYARSPEARALATLKYAYFCLLNGGPDVGLDALVQHVGRRRRPIAGGVQSSPLYRALRRAVAAHLGRWRVYPDSDWALARATFRAVFGLELGSGSAFWEQLQQL